MKNYDRSVNPYGDLLANLKGILAWIKHAKQQTTPSLPDDEYLRSAYAAIKKAENK